MAADKTTDKCENGNNLLQLKVKQGVYFKTLFPDAVPRVVNRILFNIDDEPLNRITCEKEEWHSLLHDGRDFK